MYIFIHFRPVFSRNQNPVRRMVWLWHTASWANSQGSVAIAFPCLQTFPPSPLGAFMSNDARDLQQRKVELFVGEKCSDKFRLSIFYMSQICFPSPPKEGVLRIFLPLKIRRLQPGLNPRTWVPKTSTLPLDHRSRLSQLTILKKLLYYSPYI